MKLCLKQSALVASGIYSDRIEAKIKKDSIVKVSGLGLSKPTTIGNADRILQKANIKVGQGAIPNTPQLSEKDLQPAPQSESKQLAHKVVDHVGKATGLVILGSLVVGPPIIGYLTFGTTGLLVGGTVAAPFILVFVWTLFT